MNTWMLNNMLLNNKWITEEIKEDIEKYLKKCGKKKDNDLKSMGYRKSSSRGQVYSNTCLSQETKIISHKQPKLTLKELIKVEQTKPNISRRKEVRDQRRITEKETKK